MRRASSKADPLRLPGGGVRAFDSAATQRELDPAALVRTALAAHQAQVTGTTVIRGHKAIRIRVRVPIFGRLEPVANYFVDAKTYRPLRVVIGSDTNPGEGVNLAGMPLTSLTELERATFPLFGCRYVFEFDEYRHITATAADRNLTNIGALHPHAKTG